ncbi:ferritin family protein [Actinomadura viridis]|uniref:ferritin family protein n=1 Tax=Actinomadura viridis TaxID=58110 RepID=UPI0036C15942
MTARRPTWRTTGATLACATAILTVATVPATAAAAPEKVRPSTRADALTAMHGEAFAYASYMAYATQAWHQRHRKVSELFARTARTELGDHFAKEARLIHFARGNAANLRESIKGETYEARTMYPKFAEEAKRDGDTRAARLFKEIAGDEAAHAKAFKKALWAIKHHRPRAIPKGRAAKPVALRPGGPHVKSARTLRNLGVAMRGEAFAHAKYSLYAEHARATHQPRLARLFERAARVELVEHFAAESNLAGLLQGTRANLRKSIKGETYEATTMYPRFSRRAAKVADTGAARLFKEIAGDEAAHAKAFRRALRKLDK